MDPKLFKKLATAGIAAAAVLVLAVVGAWGRDAHERLKISIDD